MNIEFCATDLEHQFRRVAIQKMNEIKHIRSRYDIGLKEAKDIMDSIQQIQESRQYERTFKLAVAQAKKAGLDNITLKNWVDWTSAAE